MSWAMCAALLLSAGWVDDAPAGATEAAEPAAAADEGTPAAPDDDERAPAADPVPAEEAGPDPAPPVETHQVLVMNLTAIDVESGPAKLVEGLVADALSRHPQLNVMTAADIARLVELEGQRQAVGCEESSCLAEVAGAMGADFVIFGQVGRLGSIYIVQLNLYDAEAGRSVGREDLRTERIEDLAHEVEPSIDRLVGPLLPEGAALPPSSSSPRFASAAAGGGGGLNVWLISGLSAMAVGVVGGGAAALGAFVFDTQLGPVEQRLLPPNVAYIGAMASGAGAVVLLGGGLAVGGGLVGLSFVMGE